MRPVRLEPHHFLRFTNRDHFLKSPKSAIKINPKKYTPLEPHQNFRACAATAEENSKAKHKEPIELHLHAPSKLGDNLKNPFNKPDTSCLFDRDLTPY